MRADILLYKAKEYFKVLTEMKDIINGNRSKQLCGRSTPTCHMGHVGLGTKISCNNCALYVTEILANTLLRGSY